MNNGSCVSFTVLACTISRLLGEGEVLKCLIFLVKLKACDLSSTCLRFLEKTSLDNLPPLFGVFGRVEVDRLVVSDGTAFEV